MVEVVGAGAGVEEDEELIVRAGEVARSGEEQQPKEEEGLGQNNRRQWQRYGGN